MDIPTTDPCLRDGIDARLRHQAGGSVPLDVLGFTSDSTPRHRAPLAGRFRRLCASMVAGVREHLQRFHEARQAQAARDTARMRRALQLDELPHEGQHDERSAHDRR